MCIDSCILPRRTIQGPWCRFAQHIGPGALLYRGQIDTLVVELGKGGGASPCPFGPSIHVSALTKNQTLCFESLLAFSGVSAPRDTTTLLKNSAATHRWKANRGYTAPPTPPRKPTKLTSPSLPSPTESTSPVLFADTLPSTMGPRTTCAQVHRPTTSPTERNKTGYPRIEQFHSRTLPFGNTHSINKRSTKCIVGYNRGPSCRHRIGTTTENASTEKNKNKK